VVWKDACASFEIAISNSSFLVVGVREKVERTGEGMSYNETRHTVVFFFKKKRMESVKND
jgi:hypothetical protein